jgi:Fur family transcriptional regulator, iron response regulator
MPGVMSAKAVSETAMRERMGCPVHDLKAMLRDSGLRPTRQRISLGWVLFAKGDRHITAEGLYEEALKARVPVSLATVYNTLHQFRDAGLLRQVAVDGAKTYFDTNTSDHHHFYIEGAEGLVDIPGAPLNIGALPEPPAGMEIDRVDVIVRLRKKD